MSDVATRLRALVATIRRTPTPIKDIIPLLDEAATEVERLAERYNSVVLAETEHCKDCCCARCWKALGITEYTGKSIPEHIDALRAEVEHWRKGANEHVSRMLYDAHTAELRAEVAALHNSHALHIDLSTELAQENVALRARVKQLETGYDVLRTSSNRQIERQRASLEAARWLLERAEQLAVKDAPRLAEEIAAWRLPSQKDASLPK
jgi:hypothetical protein